MEPVTTFQLPRQEQNQCLLFEVLPGEVRDRIFAFALKCFDDPDQLYEKDTPYWRPNCLAPPKTNAALLQTCQRIYTEAWFRPWASLTHKFWLAWEGRLPEKRQYRSVISFGDALNRVFRTYGKVDIDEIQVFAQLCYLQPGHRLSEILALEHFNPHSITVTIRHHDWWSWESDDRLHIGARWVNECRFPDIVKTIKVELESLQRKKDQIDWMVDMMRNTWHFQTFDGTVFSAAKEDVIEARWSGNSTWQSNRWVRDENRPDEVDYHVKTVVWRPDRERTSVRNPAPDLTAPDHFKIIEDWNPAISRTELQEAGVAPGTEAGEARRIVQEFVMHRADAEGGADFGIFNDDYDQANFVEQDDGEILESEPASEDFEL